MLPMGGREPGIKGKLLGVQHKPAPTMCPEILYHDLKRVVSLTFAPEVLQQG